MGKRELVLIALFAAIGVVVYQFTAPPPPPGSEAVSVGGIFDRIKRQIHGTQETATAESRESLTVDPQVRLVRINLPLNNDVTITGGDGQDITVEMKATARGYDQAEAKAVAANAKIQLERAADAVALTMNPGIVPLPGGRGRGGRPGFISQATIIVSVPKRLLIRMEPHFGQLTVRDVAGLEVMSSRGATTLSDIAGPISLTQNGSRLDVDGAASLKLTTRNVTGTIKRVSGAMTLDATGAELRIENVAGPLDIEERNAELTIDGAKLLKPPFRFNGNGGQLRVKDLRVESRIDGRNTDLEVALAAAAPVTIYSTGEAIVVTAPPAGYALDAFATEGRISLDDGNLAVPTEGEQRVTGEVRGGGPSLTLRATRADIRVRKPEGK